MHSLLATLLFGALLDPAPADRSFELTTQAGAIARHPAVQTDADFDRLMARAQAEADRRRTPAPGRGDFW